MTLIGYTSLSEQEGGTLSWHRLLHLGLEHGFCAAVSAAELSADRTEYHSSWWLCRSQLAWCDSRSRRKRSNLFLSHLLADLFTLTSSRQSQVTCGSASVSVSVCYIHTQPLHCREWSAARIILHSQCSHIDDDRDSVRDSDSDYDYDTHHTTPHCITPPLVLRRYITDGHQ